MSNRQPWSEKEKDACSRMFVKSLAVGYLPGKKEIIDAQQKEPILQARTWIQIKNCILTYLELLRVRRYRHVLISLWPFFQSVCIYLLLVSCIFAFVSFLCGLYPYFHLHQLIPS